MHNSLSLVQSIVGRRGVQRKQHTAGFLLRASTIGLAMATSAGTAPGSSISSTNSTTNCFSTATPVPAVDRSPPPPPPEAPQRYRLLEKRRLSPDTCFLRFGLPEGRDFLGSDPELPTCLKVTMPAGVYPDEDEERSKSYSPISHPTTRGTFDLLVKGYPYRPKGGVGKWLCDLEPSKKNRDDEVDSNSYVTAAVKSPRLMHGSPSLYGRWKHVGLVAGGTGIAPLFQLAVMLLSDSHDDDGAERTSVSLVNVNREDALLRDELDALVESSGGRFRVYHSMTGGTGGKEARGTVELARRFLPSPSANKDDTMIFVCGTDGFVAHWGGPVGRGPPKPYGTKGPKIQGPLLGVLKEAGYRETEVFKY